MLNDNNNWTDCLCVCKQTGKGYSINQIYREDGNPQEAHPYEDFSCHYEFGNGKYWYTVFDGHNGNKIQIFSDALTAEVYFGLPDMKTSDQVKELLQNGFRMAENCYLKTNAEKWARKTALQYDLEGLSSYEAYQKYPQHIADITQLNRELSLGAAAAAVLIHNNQLYVANVGTCRVLLGKTDANSVLKVVQLSIDHDFDNEDELLRLNQVGLDNVEQLRHNNQTKQTRCLGNYMLKEGYREVPYLSKAIQAPIIAEPDICGPIALDDSCRFLLLMTAEMYKCIEQATGTDQVNKFIAQWIVEQFREQSTLVGVAQAVVDKAVRLHHDWYMANAQEADCEMKREDITLVLRNFNYPLHHRSNSSTMSSQNVSDSTIKSCWTTTTSSSSQMPQPHVVKEIGADKKVKAYVDFGQLNENLEAAKQSGQLPAWWPSS